MWSNAPPQFGTLIKTGTSTIWNKCHAGLRASFTEIIQNEPRDMSPAWSRVLGGSLYSIDGTQADSLCYSESSMVWLTSLLTTFNRTTHILEVPNACCSYKQLKTSTSSLFTPVLSVTGIDCLQPLPMFRLSRILGKASQVCLSSFCNPTRLSHLLIVLTGDLGNFTCFIRHRSFYTG